MRREGGVLWIIAHGRGAGGQVKLLTQEQADLAKILALYPEVSINVDKEDPQVKTIQHDRGLLHIETPLGVVNIRVGLTDRKGRAVDSIVVIPDALADEPKVVLYGRSNTRLVRLKGGAK